MADKKLNTTNFSEDKFGRKIDRCLTDTLVKGAGGLFIGTVFSVLFFKRRTFPKEKLKN